MKVIELRENGSKRVYTKNDLPSMTDQSMKDEVDVNYIIEKARKTGQIPHIAKIQGQFADVSDLTDLHDSMIRVQHAKHEFSKLPLQVQKRFGYDIRELVEFLGDPSNYEEAKKLGLVTRLQNKEDLLKSPKEEKEEKQSKPKDKE